MLLACGLMSINSLAQFGNEWIDYDQQYWKYPVVEDGFVRISYQDLQQAGFPVSTIDPRNIQVFGRGAEEPVIISGEDDGTFDPEDFIEVYCLGNDGWLDLGMYDEPDNHAHEGYSLFNDTAHYFITFNTSLNNSRISFEEAGSLDALPTLDYRWRTSEYFEANDYHLGKQDPNGISLPYYEAAEGWFDFRFAKGATAQKVIETPGALNSGDFPDAEVVAKSASASLAVGEFNHHLQVGWGNDFNIEVDTVYYGYQLNRFEFSIPASELGSSMKITHRSIDDLGVATDYHAVGTIHIQYPADFDTNGNAELFSLENTINEDEVLLELTGFIGNNPRLFVSSKHLELEVVEEEGLLRARVPFDANGEMLDLLLVFEDDFADPANIVPVSGDGYFENYVAQNLDSAFVIVTHPSLLNAAANYAFYRESQGMEALLVDAEELYMQYAAGVWKHPISIRRFCDHLLQSWDSDPSHLFIIGKSIHEMKISNTQGARNNPEYYAQNMVPTWGWPATDLAMTSGLGETIIEAAIPTGRLAASNQSDVLEYLNKVVIHESNEPAAWMKNIMHFGGGGNEYEQNLFSAYLSTYEGLVEDTCFGGNVHTFLKTTTDPIQLNLSDSISILIEEGVSLMTFFGHASSTGFDQNIDSPADYDNQGKFPLLIGNSCYTGNIHLPSGLSTSEIFVLEPERGVIGFIAKGDLGIPSYLNLWTENFYRQIFQVNYGKSIGQCMVEAVKQFQGQGNSFYHANTILTFGLHGDPAVRLNPHEKPDYVITPEQVSFDPKEVTAQADSFKVKIAVQNIGKAINETFGVEIIRHFPDGTDTSLSAIIDAPGNVDTVTFTFATDRVRGVGQNNFDIFVDYPAVLVDELDNIGNNVLLGVDLLVTSGDLIPVYPYDFAVVPDDQLTLKASTGYAFEPEKTYVLQIDTVDTYDSPELQTQLVSQSGGVVEWQPNLNLPDSTVYFWRCSADSVDEDGYNWRESSFQYIDGKRGWGQDHFFQFKNDGFNRIDYVRDTRKLDYFVSDLTLKCSVYGNPNTNFEVLATRYQIDLDVQDYAGCGNKAALHVAVIDSTTLAPWESNYAGQFPDNDFGNLMSCAEARARPERYFIFRQNNPAELSGFVDMMQNAVPDGNYLLIYTWKFADYDGWDANEPAVYDVFADLGAEQIGNAQDSVPFIFFMRKGYPESVQELYGTTIDDFLELEVDMEGILGVGEVSSPVIGPAMSWGEANWKLDALEPELNDSTSIRLMGRTNQGAEEELASIFEQPEGMEEIEDYTTAEDHPYLRIKGLLTDFVTQTPPQIDRWHVMYSPAPECALNPHIGTHLSADTLEEGAFLEFSIVIENISEFDMDSLLVAYWVEDESREVHKIVYERQAPLLAGQILHDTIQVETFGLGGENILWVEANPFLPGPGEYDQLEQHHFNNIAQLIFRVNEDKINPLLDVTFDGQHILDGDIVSGEPHIMISLDDENEFLVMETDADTANFKMFLSTPSVIQRPIYFNALDIQWITATAPENKFRIEYFPLLDEDGEYELLVQANDRSGNLSGDIDYRIGFEVINKPSITQVMNYPNPFSTRTQFVFTLTGSQVPDDVRIQIMTITGRIVREIDSAELGALNIGRNFTDFWWDGTDQFGDRLANGVYLYRVKAKLNGQELDLRESSADQYFKEGFGKMYLMR
jgi:hypothetical protein